MDFLPVSLGIWVGATGELKSVPNEVALFMGVHSPELKELPKPRAQPVLDGFGDRTNRMEV